MSNERVTTTLFELIGLIVLLATFAQLIV